VLRANSTVEQQLLGDWMQGVTPMLVPLLENYKVLIYSGQNDIILGPPLTEQALRGLDWSGAAAYNKARKSVWRADKAPKDVAGYWRQVGDFSQVVVRGAGHMVPGDQPVRALDMLTKFIAGK
jgi:vitellogenic carboxypeptidase-like protein